MKRPSLTSKRRTRVLPEVSEKESVREQLKRKGREWLEACRFQDIIGLVALGVAIVLGLAGIPWIAALALVLSGACVFTENRSTHTEDSSGE